MRLIKQDNKFNCGQACLAMVLGRNLEYVKLFMDRDCSEESGLDGDLSRLGVCELEMSWFLFRHGITHHVFYPKEAFPEDHYVFKAHGMLKLCSIDFLNEHMQRGVAIVGTESLNRKGMGHWIVISDGMIFDPSMERTYGEFDQVRTNCAIIIRKAKRGQMGRKIHGNGEISRHLEQGPVDKVRCCRCKA